MGCCLIPTEAQQIVQPSNSHLDTAPSTIDLEIIVNSIYYKIYPMYHVFESIGTRHSFLGIYEDKDNLDFDAEKAPAYIYTYHTTPISGALVYGHGSIEQPTIDASSLNAQYMGAIFDWDSTNKQYYGLGLSPSLFAISVNTAPGLSINTYTATKDTIDVSAEIKHAKLASYAYLDYSNLPNLLEPMDLEPILGIKSVKDWFYAYIATNTDEVHLVFRGTVDDDGLSWAVNWALNVGYNFQTLNGYNVHQGFITSLETIYNNFLPTIKKYVKAGKTLAITGHSLGAALAAITCMRLLEEETISANVYLFACPPCGDYNFATYFESKPCVSLITQGDDIASNKLEPALWLGFYSPQKLYTLQGPEYTHSIKDYIAALAALNIS